MLYPIKLLLKKCFQSYFFVNNATIKPCLEKIKALQTENKNKEAMKNNIHPSLKRLVNTLDLNFHF